MLAHFIPTGRCLVAYYSGKLGSAGLRLALVEGTWGAFSRAMMCKFYNARSPNSALVPLFWGRVPRGPLY